MSYAIFGAVLLTGLLGGVHCAGMCGGIVAALSGEAGSNRLPLHLAYNLARVTSYAIAGALAGMVGSLGLMLDGVLPVQLVLYILANGMLIALGLYLTGVSHVATALEVLVGEVHASLAHAEHTVESPLPGRGPVVLTEMPLA